MANPTECSVCFHKYNESERRPRTLQCGHCFCTLCLEDIIKARQVTCPTCRATHQANNVTHIPISYGVEALLKMMNVSEPSFPLSSAAAEGEGSKKQIASINRRQQPLLKEQKNITEGLMTDMEEVQSQLDQYCQQLDGWMAEHLQQIDTLSNVMEQHKAAVQLLQRENNRVTAMKQQGEERKKMLKASLESLQAVSTTQEFDTAIDHSNRCNEETKEWNTKFKQEYPNPIVVNTSCKVRGDTRTALDALSGHAEAEPDANRPSCNSTLLVEDIRRVLMRGATVYGVQQESCSRITLDEGKIYLHCLLDHPPPTHARTLSVSQVLKFMDQSSTVAFLDLAWGGSTRGRVHIRLRPNNTLATQFMLLCTGQHKHSYINTTLLEVMWKGEPGEWVVFGDYQYNTGWGGAPLMTHTGEEYTEPWRARKVGARFDPKSNKSSQFVITTRDSNNDCLWVFGNVESGLKVVKAAVNHSNIKQVNVIDCGVVLSL